MLICKRIKRAEIDAIDSSTSSQFLFEPAFPRLFLILKLLPNSTAESALEEVAVNLKTKSTLDLLQKSIFAPLAPQFWGEPEFSRPPILGSQCGLGVSPSRATGVDARGHPRIYARGLLNKPVRSLLSPRKSSCSGES